MTSHGVLNHTLKAILDGIAPQQEDWVVRFKIIEDLKNVVSSVGYLRDATVEPFGSFVSNLFTRWGDLDISITLTGTSCLSSAGKKLKQNLLDELLRALRQKAGWCRLQCISNARVPILKFESGQQRISCDVSIDNLEGQIKSNFLFWVSMIDGRFRDMVLLVKEWAKAHKINDSKAGTLNSYSLSLLVIFHLQTCVPAILPPLKDIYPRNAIDDLKGVRIDAERRIKDTCFANITEFQSNKSRALNQSSLSELFISFLAKFSDLSERAKHVGVCTFSGQWESINSNTRWLPKTYALFIEDPFEQPENSARAVSAKNLVKISEAFRSTYYRLVYTNQSDTSLLDMLVRPQVSQVITGKPLTSTTQSGHSLTNRQEASRNVYTPGQSLVSHHQQASRLQQLENRSSNPAIRNKGNHNQATQRKSSYPNNLTNPRQETVPNNFTMQRKESNPNSVSKARQNIQKNNVSKQKQKNKQNEQEAKTGKRSYPNNLTNPRQEAVPTNLTMQRKESNPNNVSKPRQEIRKNNVSKQKQESKQNKHSSAHSYRNQTQQKQESKQNDLSKQKQESKQNDLSKQKQASNGNNLNKHSSAHSYRNQTQQIWRPKSEG